MKHKILVDNNLEVEIARFIQISVPGIFCD